MKTQELTEPEIASERITVETLKKITSFLTANTENVHDLSLTTGHAGIALFLYYYARAENDTLCNETAQHLLVHLYERIIKSNIKDITELLPGIGWMFAHLSNQDLIEIGQDEILKGIDSVIMQHIHYQFSKSLVSGGVLSKGSYLIERYKGTKDDLKQIQIAEGLASIVDELKFNYQLLMLNNGRLVNGFSNPRQQMIFQKANNLSKIIYFLSQVHALNIYNFGVKKMLEICSNELLSLLLEYKDQDIGCSDIKKFLSFLRAIHALKVNKIDSDHFNLSNELDYLLRKYKRHIFHIDTYPGTGDLVLAIKLLLDINAGNSENELVQGILEKLTAIIQTTVNQNKPCYVNSTVGIPNLGIKEGISGIGLTLLERTQKVSTPWLDALLLH
ncbi:MAG: hypothetical protein JWR12_3020 [Mucilaginibacter sp.]|nr:hypothetical protein [Mucilaginibacter sp.]